MGQRALYSRESWPWVLFKAGTRLAGAQEKGGAITETVEAARGLSAAETATDYVNCAFVPHWRALIRASHFMS